MVGRGKGGGGGGGGNPLTPRSVPGQSTRSIQISQIGRIPKSRSRTTTRRSTRSVSVPVNDNNNVEHYIVLPPDGGYGWFVVFIAFVINFVIDGISYTFGIFLSELSEAFEVQPSKVALISSYMGGFYYLTGPVACALCNKYGFRCVGLLGAAISALLFAVASFLENFMVFTILVGVCAGMSFCLIYTPTLLVVGFYFEKYRALATSVSVTGTSFGIMVFPIVFENQSLLGQFNWKWKFRIICGSFIVVCLLVLAFKPIPLTKVLEHTPLELDTDSIGTFHVDSNESRNITFRRVFDQYHNAAYPTVAEYSANAESHPRRPEDTYTYLAILPELSIGSGTSIANTLFKSRAGSQDTSLYYDGLMESSDHRQPGCWKGLFNCCKKQERMKILGSKVTSPYAYIRCRSKCWQSKCWNKCGNFFCAHREINRPMYRDDILYQGSLATIPEYTATRSRMTTPADLPDHYSRISRNISYHMSVSRVISQKDIDEQTRWCICCPESIKRVLVTMIDVRLFKSIAFCLITLSGFMTMVGLYIPFVFIVERANELGFPRPWPTQLLTIMGMANMVGRICCGASSFFPSLDPMVISWVTLLVGGVAVFVSGFSHMLMSHVMVVITFGVCLASFSTLRTVLLVNLVGLENLTNSFGITILFYGLANFIGIPLSSFLEGKTGTYKYCFMMAGCAIALSGLILTPIEKINNYERSMRKSKVTFN